MKPKSVQQQVEDIDEKMSLADRESLARDVAMTESMDHSAKGLKSIEMDPRVKREAIRKRMMLAKDDELSSVGNQRSSLEEEHKKLKEVIERHIPSKSEMWPGKDQHEKNQAVRHNMEFQKKYQDSNDYKTDDGKRTSVVRRYQELSRRLHPENPFAGNLDELRPN